MMGALCSKVQKTENINASEIPIFETDFYKQKKKASMKHSIAKTTQSCLQVWWDLWSMVLAQAFLQCWKSKHKVMENNYESFLYFRGD